MAKSYDLLEQDLEVLRAGGHDAVELFVEMAHKFFVTGGEPYLNSWVKSALTVMPEEERVAAVSMLLRSFFGDDQMIAQVHDEHKTVQ